MNFQERWAKEIEERKGRVVVESTPTHGWNSFFYKMFKETQMEEIQVRRFLFDDKITYPEKPYVGTDNNGGIFKDPENFRLGTNICHVRKAELIQEPKFYLRGIIIFEGKDYVFTAMVDLNNFSEADYQKVVQVAYDKIRFGQYQIGVRKESVTPIPGEGA
jgi:hypothetical protein